MAAPSSAGDVPARTLVSRLQRLRWSDVAALIESLTLLALSAAVIRVLPFATVGRLASLPLGRARTGAREALVRKVSWAVTASARRSPWRSVCFQQGLAAQIMLRRRGVDSTLYYGAAPERAQGLSAHVWVRVGTLDVVGCEAAEGFAVLATFPDRRGAESAS